MSDDSLHDAAVGATAAAAAAPAATTPEVVSSLVTEHEVPTAADDSKREEAIVEPQLVFMGTGTSSGVPRLGCLVPRDTPCKTCLEAMSKPGSLNRRRNTGALLKYHSVALGRQAAVCIDVGKQWWHSALEILPRHSLTSIDAVILTHDHMDALGGLDDLREFTFKRQVSLPIYLCQRTYDTVARMFPYLVDVTKATGSGQVPLLHFIIIQDETPFDVFGQSFMPFRVMHGPAYDCLAFRFGSVVYASDVSSIPHESRKYFRDAETVILDTLWLQPEAHISHFGIEQAIAETNSNFGVDCIAQVYLIGFNHEVNHEDTTDMLKDRGLFPRIQLAFDGMVLPINLV